MRQKVKGYDVKIPSEGGESVAVQDVSEDQRIIATALT